MKVAMDMLDVARGCILCNVLSALYLMLRAVFDCQEDHCSPQPL
jgi:hypothetical protein